MNITMPAKPNYQAPTRDPGLDILRGIGLFCIMLAHVGPPSALFQLRNFDVPLMVLVSGSAFCLSSGRHVGYFKYLLDRFIRLVIPTWIFLLIFFSTSFIGFSLSTAKYPFSLQETLLSFALIFDYVWIIRIFFLVAIMAPFIMKIKLAIRNQLVWYALVAVIYLAYEAFYLFCTQYNYQTNFILDYFILSAIPYGVVFALGIMAHEMNRTQCFLASGLFLTIFIALEAWHYHSVGNIVYTQAYKYPARSYYLFYAMGVSFLLYVLMMIDIVKSNLIGNLLAYLGRRTMWIYFWHIYVLYVFKWFEFNAHFSVKLVILLFASISLAYIQESSVALLANRISNPNSKKTLQKLLTG